MRGRRGAWGTAPMTPRSGGPASLLIVLLLFLGACEGRISDPDPPTLSRDTELRAMIRGWGVMPIGEAPTQDPARVALGRALFFDRELSGNRDISCATCHHPDRALGDGRSLPVGTGAREDGPKRMPGPDREFVPRTSPSLLNVGLGHRYLFWDGRVNRFQGLVDSPGPGFPQGLSHPLEVAAMLPVLDRTEMRGEPGDRDVLGNPNELAEVSDDRPVAVWNALTARLLAIEGYRDLFQAAFPDTPPGTIGFQHAARALAAFMREGFTAVDTPFDRFLDGDDGALTPEQKRGAELFFDGTRARCAACHRGPLLGGDDFANVGAPQVGPGKETAPPLDLGRGELLDQSFYRFVFRAPPLRNVELTAPYMHSGAYRTLEGVVAHYNDVEGAVREFDPSRLDPAIRDLYHGDEATIQALLERLDGRLRTSPDFSPEEEEALVAFLRSLTDPRAHDLAHLIPDEVPSGLPVDR